MTSSRATILTICGLIAATLALNPVPHQTSEESLRGALNAVARKQRSLNTNPQAYYEYRMDNGGKARQQVADDEEQDDNLAFIPAEGAGQLETIGDGYQHLNNRQLEKALMDYLQFPADQDTAPTKSLFRERERSGSKKRNSGNGVTSRLNGEELVKLLLEQLDSQAPDGLGSSDDDEREYRRTTYKYQTRPNDPYVTDPQLLREILDAQDRDEDEDPRQQTTYPRFPTAERRNVNALRYPLFNRDYKNLMYKRFPVAKRSAKAANKKRQATDPKIMAENLNPNKDANEKRDKLQRMDIKLRKMKNQLIEEATQISARGNMDDQEVKDDILSKLATAYSLEKLRRALKELSDSAAAERAAQAQNNLTANDNRDNSNHPVEDKRFRSSIDELQAIEKEGGNCPQVDTIERHCKATEALIGDYRQVLLAPCVMFHICNACEQDECLERFALEAEKICQEEDLESTPWSRKHCVQAAMQLPRYPPPVAREAICLLEGDEPCLAPFQVGQFARSRYLYSARR